MTAFSLAKMNVGMQPAKRGAAPVVHSYKDTGTAIATILASGYFDSIADGITTGDLMWVKGSDAVGLAELTNTSGVITASLVSALPINAITEKASGTLVAGHNMLTNPSTAVFLLPAPVAGVELSAMNWGGATGTTLSGGTSYTIGTGGTTILLNAKYASVTLVGVSGAAYSIKGGNLTPTVS